MPNKYYTTLFCDNQDNLFHILCIKTDVVTPYLNRLDKAVQMKGHNIFFQGVKNITPQLLSNSKIRVATYHPP